MAIPRSLGRYEVIELLGHGGMAALYRARDPRIGRYVAIKQLRPQFDTPELRERFAREAAAAGGLSHANIVTIYDVGEEDGLPFIAMEFVQGETFADLVKLRPPLAIARKIALTEEVCAGLAHAHEAGIVHRDIKPANLIVGPEGVVKILDFGVAKLTAGGTTVPGAIIGTLNYLSPEQITGTAVDARADIFSVGAVLYELLSHRQAFPGRVPDDVFQEILSGAPTPLEEIVPGLDVRLIDLVRCALEKDPDQRMQDISTLQQELAIVRLSLLAAEAPRPIPRRTAANAPSAALQTPPPLSVEDQASRQADRAALAARRAAQILDHLATAERTYESGDYDTAIESCKQVLLLDENDERAMALLDRIHSAIDEQQEHARLLEGERQRQASIRLAIEEAYRNFAAGQHEAAIESLERLDPSSQPLLAEALGELRHAFREIQEQRRLQAERAEHQRRVQALLEDGRVAVQQQDLDEAQRLLDTLRELDADAPETAQLAELVAAARDAAHRNARIEGALRDFDEALGQGDVSSAADAVDAIAALAGDDQRVRAARRRLDQARAALAAKEAADAKRREGEHQLDLAIAHLENGDLSAAADGLALATAALTPQHAGVVALSSRLQKAAAARAAAEAAERLRQEIAGLVEGASRRVESAGSQTDELLLALRDVDRALTLSPGNPDAATLKAAIEASLAALREAARVKATVNNARTRFANGKHQAALRLLEEFQPAHPDVEAALAEFRDALATIEEEKRAERERIEKQQRVAQLLDSARAALREHRLDAAVDHLTAAGDLAPTAPELAALLDRVRQEQEAARLNAEVERLLASFDDRLAADDLPSARAVLESADAQATADARVHSARQRLEKVLAARAAAEALAQEAEAQCRAAEASFETGDIDAALKSAARALNADPQHARAQALSKRAAAALEERAAAEAARQRRQASDDLVAAAAAHLRDADVQGDHQTLAMQSLSEALALDPSHEAALAVKAAVESALVAQRQARAAIRNARNRFSLGKHRAAIQLLEGVEINVQPLVAETLKELRDALNEIEDRRRREKEAAGDATILIPMPAVEPIAHQAGDAERGSNTRASSATETASEMLRDDDAATDPAQARTRIWLWGSVAAALFFLILIVLYRMRVH